MKYKVLQLGNCCRVFEFEEKSVYLSFVWKYKPMVDKNVMLLELNIEKARTIWLYYHKGTHALSRRRSSLWERVVRLEMKTEK